MTMQDDHRTYANGLTLIRLRLAQNSPRVRWNASEFTRLEKAIADADTTDSFTKAVKDWAKLMEQTLGN